MSDKRRNYRVTFSVATVLLIGVAVFLISVLSNIPGARVDMTSDKLFTLSPAAVDVLEGLQVPVQVKLYITPEEKMPTAYKNLERDITEQLRNYERISDGQLEFSVHNPQDDQQMQEDLISKGIRPFQVQSVDKDEFGVKRIWSALTIAYKDYPEEVVPQILPEMLPNFENLVIVPLYRLTREKAPKVALYAPKQAVDQQIAMMYLQQGMQPPEPQDVYTMVGQMLQQEHYEFERIELTADSPIPADADLLVVLRPQGLDDRQRFEINRALSNGLDVIMAVQAHDYSYSPSPQGGWQIGAQAIDTGVGPLLAGFGLGIVEDHFLDENMQVLELPREVNLGGLRMQTREPVEAPIQIRVTQDQLDQDSPITHRIGQLLYLWGTPVTLDTAVLAQNELAATTLMTSSARCWESDFAPGTVAPAVFDPTGKEMLGEQPLAVLVEGTFPDTFAETGVPEWPAQPAAADTTAAAGPEPGVRPLLPAPGRLLLTGCAKMFDDNLIQGAQNALVLLNSVDYLTGSEALLSIRAKTMTARTIRQVPTGEKAVWRFVTIFLVPVLLAVYGIVRSANRRREATRYRRSLARRPTA